MTNPAAVQAPQAKSTHAEDKYSGILTNGGFSYVTAPRGQGFIDKTTKVAASLGKDMHEEMGHYQMRPFDITGRLMPSLAEGDKFEFQKSRIFDVLERGGIVVIDEVNRLTGETLSLLREIGDAIRKKQETFKVPGDLPELKLGKGAALILRLSPDAQRRPLDIDERDRIILG